MKQLRPNLWLADGDTVSFFTLPYSTRMTIIRLRNRDLWVHSPVRLTADLRTQVNALGNVRWLIAPNHLHHLFVADWQQAWPEADLWGTQEVQNKRPDLHFRGTLDDTAGPWREEIDQCLFSGSPAMTECVFFHRSSATLIVTDLIENFDPAQLTPIKRVMARLAGIVAPKGGMPLDWRLSFRRHRAQARANLEQILCWRPERIVMAHGMLVAAGCDAFLRRAFAWLGPSPDIPHRQDTDKN